MSKVKNKYVWIIGASFGIGKDLVKQFQKQGAIIILSARSKEELEKIKNKKDIILNLDVTDYSSFLKAWSFLNEKNIRPDFIIYAAGTYEPMPISKFDLDSANKILQVNLTGAFNLTALIKSDLAELKGLNLVFIASLAGYFGMPNSGAYGASKAGLINFCETLKIELAKFSIKVRVINPGFVKSRLTAKNDFNMPFILESEKAAKIIYHKLVHSKKFAINFPFFFAFIFKILQKLPSSVRFLLLKKL